MTDALDELLTRRAPARADKFDLEARTVEVIWSTGARVKRYDYDGAFIEELSMNPKHVRLDRLNAGASVLDAHTSYSMRDRVGTVVPGTAKISNGVGSATIRLSTGELGETLLRDIEAGHRLQISVGYSVHKFERREGADDELPTKRAIDWEPQELSAVPVPADPGAHTRSREFPMPPEVAEVIEDEIRRPAADPSGAAARAAERQRVADLMGVSSRHEVNPEFLERHVRAGTSIEKFRELVLEAQLEANENRSPVFSHVDSRDGQTPSRRESVVVALSSLLGVKPMDGQPTDLVGRSAVDIGRAHLQHLGMDTRSMGDADVSQLLVSGQRGFLARSGVHTVSDYPSLLQEAGQRALLARFAAEQPTFKKFSVKRNARDFRQQSHIRPGEAPELLKVNESGEIKSGTLEEEKRGLQIATYARIFSLTFQSLTNDDLNAFGDFINAFADTGIRLEGDRFYGLVAANSFGGVTMSDDLPFFHADHGNLAVSGGAIGVETVGAAEEAMRLQKNVNGNAGAGVAPATLVVGPKRVVAARKFVAEINAATTDSVNPYAGTLSVEVENRYEGVGWWLFGDAGSRPAFIHGYLNGHAEGPQVETRDGWEVLGTQYRSVLHFGTNVFDHRAAYFNPGQ